MQNNLILDCCYSLQTLPKLALQIVSILKNNLMVPILMFADVGGGKTTLVQAIGKHLGVIAPITSPTYNLLQSYKIEANEQLNTNEKFIAKQMWHADLYRLNNTNDLLELGIEELLHNEFIIVEWPQLLEPYCFNHYKIIITKIDDDNRHLQLLQCNLNA